ncbi:uncharacterized protein SPPG_01945 [Spizellomyces punctatus DAOM BR117]|uniref:sn-1-specific diacylglycerol lipase n=1 Tax=Spizellomyces punctatus (strain DAOM BR117) TaxID=645134 RepID=A0A0L0HPH0_SPIPD|nr:uncharacterized protein SPPG_01945 [Spizellomyces punctatus DAOM BR117]KND02865.1 hypothetical protein SPPG_01945 [Spizellomyces punctatus DAOM BR117]|eukprot:XP_016610904.1 hypothetical protein SPPG_01945 [Spizellomyces punctatus DAOM BR117]
MDMETEYTIIEPSDETEVVLGRTAEGTDISVQGDPSVSRTPREKMTNVFTGLRFLVGVASAASEVGFAAAKLGTKFGIGIARGIVDGVGEATGLDATGVTPLVSNTLAFAEFCAIAGIETGRFWTKFGISTADNSVKALNHVFGSSEVATAIRQFAALVRREMSEGENGLSLADIGTVDTVRALMAWVSLQSTTSLLWDYDAVNSGKTLVLEQGGPIIEEPDEPVEWTHVEGAAAVEGSIGTPSADTSEPNPADTDTTQELVADLRRYIKFATGSYGRNYIGALNGQIPTFGFAADPDPRHVPASAEHQFFASHTDTPLEGIFHSTHDTDGFDDIFANHQTYKPTLYVIADHAAHQIIVSIRGTQSFHDVLVDLTCEYDFFDDEQVHSGMMRAAQALAGVNHVARVRESVQSLLEQHPSYSLLLTGHSLGAGLATCLALVWTDRSTGTIPSESGLPAGRNVRCYAFAPPCVVTPALSASCTSFITSFVFGTDLVCRLSLGSVRDLTRVVAWLHTHPSERDDLLQRVAFAQGSDSFDNGGDIDLRRRIERECMVNDKLYPAGRIVWVQETDGVLKVIQVERPSKALGQILFTRTMARDHLPNVYSNVVQRL